MKYKLELTEEQAKLISNACDLYCRIGLGQFDRIVEFCMDKEFVGRTEKMSDEEFHDWLDRKDKAENKMYEAREFIFPKLQGKLHTYGIGHDTESNMAWNIHQVLRYHVGNDERKPFAVYGELPKIEKVLEREDYLQYEDKWIAYHREGMSQILHGKCIRQNLNCLYIKKKKGRRMDYIDVSQIIKVFDNKKECYEFNEVEE